MKKLIKNKTLMMGMLFLFITFNVIETIPLNAEPQRKSQNNSKKSTTNSSNSSTKKAASPKETSAEVKKQQQATQKEIKQTEAQIKENEKSVKKGLTELGKIETDIDYSKKRVKEISNQVAGLDKEIGKLEQNIKQDESELAKLREEYLKAIKKVRLSKRNNSELAFIFSSSSFNQALRRLRYLKEFSKWKDRQSTAIKKKIDTLKKEEQTLAQARQKHDETLKTQQAEQKKLENQYVEQDRIVAQLKANGDILKAHLEKKQSEANELNSRVSALIAEEQRIAEQKRIEEERKAEEERRIKAAEQAKAEEERKRIEEQERQRLAAEQQKKREEELAAKNASENEKKKIAEQEKKAAEAKKAEEKKLAEAKKEQEKKAAEAKKAEEKKLAEAKKAEENKKKQTSTTSYADARQRKPRSDAGNAAANNSKTTASSVSTTTVKPTGTFADMKGKLPNPVVGTFKVTSRFGPQSHPELPDIVYDNPGIDAETAAGTSAIAVFDGKVSGVYMLPGYNTVIIVNHGNYYTVYGNISTAAVKVGDSVKAGQGLGRVAADEDDASHGSIHFEVWKNRDKLNPLDWIRN